jgi:hypothetical protein
MLHRLGVHIEACALDAQGPARDTRRYAKPRAPTSDSGTDIAPAFCGHRGTPLYIQVATRPDVVRLRVCTPDNPERFRPEADTFVRSAQPREPVDAEVPRYPEYPPAKSYPVAAGDVSGPPETSLWILIPIRISARDQWILL